MLNAAIHVRCQERSTRSRAPFSTHRKLLIEPLHPSAPSHHTKYLHSVHQHHLTHTKYLQSTKDWQSRESRFLVLSHTATVATATTPCLKSASSQTYELSLARGQHPLTRARQTLPATSHHAIQLNNQGVQMGADDVAGILPGTS